MNRQKYQTVCSAFIPAREQLRVSSYLVLFLERFSYHRHLDPSRWIKLSLVNGKRKLAVYICNIDSFVLDYYFVRIRNE